MATAACSRDMASNAANCFLEYIDFPFVTQPRAQRLAQEKLQRQKLYKEFTETASKCYINALQHDKADTPALVELYVRVGRMRILSSPKVVESAELVARRIVDTFLEPNRTFLELRDMANNGSIDLLRDFSETRRVAPVD